MFTDLFKAIVPAMLIHRCYCHPLWIADLGEVHWFAVALDFECPNHFSSQPFFK